MDPGYVDILSWFTLQTWLSWAARRCRVTWVYSLNSLSLWLFDIGSRSFFAGASTVRKSTSHHANAFLELTTLYMIESVSSLNQIFPTFFHIFCQISIFPIFWMFSPEIFTFFHLILSYFFLPILTGENNLKKIQLLPQFSQIFSPKFKIEDLSGTSFCIIFVGRENNLAETRQNGDFQVHWPPSRVPGVLQIFWVAIGQHFPCQGTNNDAPETVWEILGLTDLSKCPLLGVVGVFRIRLESCDRSIPTILSKGLFLRRVHWKLFEQDFSLSLKGLWENQSCNRLWGGALGLS